MSTILLEISLLFSLTEGLAIQTHFNHRSFASPHRATSHEMKKRGIAGVVVGFPATSVTDSRSRFCLSAAHTQQDMEDALVKLNEVSSAFIQDISLSDLNTRPETNSIDTNLHYQVGDVLGLKYSKHGGTPYKRS